MNIPAFMNPRTGPGPEPEAAALVAAATRIAGFPFVEQALDHWCWAAVASGIDAVRGASQSQCAIAQKYALSTNYPDVSAILRSAACCPPTPTVDTDGYLDEVLTMLTLSGMPYRFIAPGDAASARTEVRNGRPVAFRIQWPGGGGHFIAAVGVDAADRLIIYDPSRAHSGSGHSASVPDDALASAYDGTGCWTHIYFVH